MSLQEELVNDAARAEELELRLRRAGRGELVEAARRYTREHPTSYVEALIQTVAGVAMGEL